MARLLGVSEGTVSYHLERLATGAMDGRGMKTFKAASVAGAIEHWRQSGQDGAIDLAALHAWLVAEHGYDGSLRSVQRFWARHYQAPVIRARRRVETPPGVPGAGGLDALLAGRGLRSPHTPNAASEWMRAILHKDINLDILHSEIGDVPELETLLQRLYDGRPSDRNRSMVVLATRRGLSSGRICDFLGIERRGACRNYLRTPRRCCAACARRSNSPPEDQQSAIKQAVFGLLHEPPSNYGINRTTWIMPDLRRVLRETGYPVCPQVIRTITKAAGYRWRKARIVLAFIRPELHREA